VIERTNTSYCVLLVFLLTPNISHIYTVLQHNKLSKFLCLKKTHKKSIQIFSHVKVKIQILIFVSNKLYFQNSSFVEHHAAAGASNGSIYVSRSRDSDVHRMTGEC
jgi:hypothetical protein